MTLEGILIGFGAAAAFGLFVALLMADIEATASGRSTTGYLRLLTDVVVSGAFGLAIALIVSGLAGAINLLTGGLGVYAGVCMLMWRDVTRAPERKRRRASHLAGATAEGLGPRRGRQ